MTRKSKIYLSLAIVFIASLLGNSVFAVSALPTGGSSFGTAVLLSPGTYQGGSLIEWQDPIYYSIQVKAGQEINAEAKYFTESGCTVHLYDANQEELTFNYDTAPKVTWLTSTDGKYYLRIDNDASAIESFSLEISLTNYYDANSGTDAGDTFDKALTITPGTYNGYLTGFSGIMNTVGNDWQDIYKIGLQKGITYEFKATPSSKTTLTLSLYDSNRQLLKEEDSVNAGAIVSLFLTPSANTNIFVSVLHGEYPYQDALVNYQLEIKSSSITPQKYYACEGEYCESVGEFSSKEDCQKATTKTCYQTPNCDGECEVIPCTKDSDCPTGKICKNSKCETIIPPPECTKDSDCPTGSVCKNNECVIGVCQNECSSSQTKCFDNFNYYKCGDYNKDGCLEWSTPVYCGEGNKCENEKCVPADGGCQCSAWMNKECAGNSCQQNEMYQTRTCTPKGCDKEEQCLTDPTCKVIPPPECVRNSDCPAGNVCKDGKCSIIPIPPPGLFEKLLAGLKNLNWPYIGIIAGMVVAAIIILVLLLRKKPEKKENIPPATFSGSKEADKPTVGYKHPCKYCDKLIPPNSTVCPLCGKSNPLGPYRCPKCHEPVEKDWQTCSHCGQNLRIVCPKCGKVTFFGDYCEDCGARLLVTCPYCGQEQPPLGDKCIKCEKPMQK